MCCAVVLHIVAKILKLQFLCTQLCNTLIRGDVNLFANLKMQRMVLIGMLEK